MKPLRKLLVIRWGALGDLVHLSPSLAVVKAVRPELEVHLLTGPAYASLAAMMPGVDKTWFWDKKSGWPGLLRLMGELRATGIDGVVNLHPSFKTWLLAQGLRPVRTVTYRKEKLRMKGHAQRAVSRLHAVEDFYRPFRRLLDLPEKPVSLPALALPGSPASVGHAASGQGTSSSLGGEYREMLRDSGALVQPSGQSDCPAKVEGERWIGLIPGVGRKRANRAWLPDSYKELIAVLLEQPDVRVLLIGGPDEAALSARLEMEIAHPRLENHCGRHDIPGTARLLSQCDQVVGGDTGPLHLAAAIGVPVTGIFGPTNPARTGPVGRDQMRVVTPPASLSCWPCEAPECPLSGDAHMACMREIQVKDVLSAIDPYTKTSTQ